MESEQEEFNSSVCENIVALSDEELKAILNSSRHKYTEFAVRIARTEARMRGLFAAHDANAEGSDTNHNGEKRSRQKKKHLGSRSSIGCYVQVWREKNFQGETICLNGTAEYFSLDFVGACWNDQISSLRVGPEAFVLAYSDKNFKGETISFGPNQEVADLSDLKFDNDIDSIKIIDSMKIFDCTSSAAAFASGATRA